MRGGLFDSTWREKLPPICPGCGYNLTGIESTRCPECGRGIVWTELRTNARTVYHALRQVEDVNDVLNVGVYLGSAALVIVLLFFWLDWAVGLARVVGFFLALATLGAGLQALRVRRFPEWAEEHLLQRPNYPKAAALILGAVAIIALAIFLP
jgi:predicted RNA-binding Zn-ribbon protein involved in translation (DUF1610 family)